MKKTNRNLLLSGLLMVSAVNVFADATNARGAIGVCVQNPGSDTIRVRAVVNQAQKMTHHMTFKPQTFTIPDNDIKCVILDRFDSGNWQAWDQNVTAQVSLELLGEKDKVLKSDSATVHLYVWVKKLLIDNMNESSGQYPQFSLGHLTFSNNGDIDRDTINKLPKTYSSSDRNFEYYCGDNWPNNCGVATIFWNPLLK